MSSEWSLDSCNGRGRSSSSESGASHSLLLPLYSQRISLDLVVPTMSSERKEEEINTGMGFRFLDSVQPYKEELQQSTDGACSSTSRIASSASDLSLFSSKQTASKDFVCPITTQVLNDPLTRETDQTYERKANQEWLDHDNLTWPITRHSVQNAQLPGTNYVLEWLTTGCNENYPCLSSPPSPQSVHHGQLMENNQFVKSFTRPSSSPTNIISQISGDSTLTMLRFAVSQLCTSDVLSESELAVMQIEQLWREANMEDGIMAILSAPEVVKGFVEILFNSVKPKVLKGTVFLLSKLASREKFVIQTLTAVDSDVDHIAALFKKGLVEAVILVYQLGTSCERLIKLDMVDALIMSIKEPEGDLCGMFPHPKSVSVLLLAKILKGSDRKYVSGVIQSLISERVVESIVSNLHSELVEVKISAVGILLRCLEEDGSCRKLIAYKTEVGSLFDCFDLLNNGEQFQIISFLFELGKQNRRSFNDQILQDVKEKGGLSIMHLLLNYLQTSLHDQKPIVAGLLLQLDLLSESQRMSMYREEAIDALIACLKNSDFPSSQLGAAAVILALQGRFSSSGKPIGRAILLKYAGMNQSHMTITKAKRMGHVTGDSKRNGEEKVADDWEKKMAFALASHEFGLLFEALAAGLENGQAELFRCCHVSATWLVHMLSFLPDTGLKGAARVCLLKQFISILKSAEDIDDKALAMLALRSFMSDPEGLNDMMLHTKDILKSLRNLKEYSSVAYDVLKLLSEGKETSRELWNDKGSSQFDCNISGEVLSLVHFKDRIYSGHSDGTIKVWNIRENAISQVLEIRGHTKPVTSLDMSSSGEKLYSGSTDKTIRVWSVVGKEIRCIEVLNTKDHVHNLAVVSNIICYSPQGSGVKVLSWKGGTKTLNSSKQVTCLSLVRGKLYCGCSDKSIQELDLASGTMSTIQSSGKKFLGKANPVHAIEVHDGLLYSVNASLDGSTVKIWNTLNFNLVESFHCTMDVRSIAVTSELIYLGCTMGCVEVWCKKKLSKVEALYTGGSGRVQCMAIDPDGEILVVGTSDGRIQAWGPS